MGSCSGTLSTYLIASVQTRILIVTVEPLPPYGSNFVVYLGRTDKRFLDGNIRRPLLWRQGRMYPNRRFMHILDYELLLMVHEGITG